MATKVFSKKEALLQGFRMTRKYFGFILMIFIIYAAFEILAGLLNYGAGRSISKESIKRLYMESAAADNFYTYLEKTGYINKYGIVQKKLQDIRNASELTLTVNLEADRERIFRFLNTHRYRLPFPKGVFYLLTLTFWVVGIILQIGFVKIGLLLSRDQRPAVSELFANGALFFTYILASICYGLAAVGGFILLIIPGIILTIMLGMYAYLIVDKNMGPIESLRASCAITKGARWQLFCFGALLLLVNIGGFLCLIVGLLFTVPATCIASAYVYDQLSKQKEAAIV